MHPRIILFAVATVLGATACSSASDGTAPPSVPAVSDVGATGDVTAFCAEFASLVGDRPESYVGSAEHLADTEGLLAVSPPGIAPELVTFRDFLLSGAIDSEADPDSNLLENWPDDVQSAIDNLGTFATDNC